MHPFRKTSSRAAETGYALQLSGVSCATHPALPMPAAALHQPRLLPFRSPSCRAHTLPGWCALQMIGGTCEGKASLPASPHVRYLQHTATATRVNDSGFFIYVSSGGGRAYLSRAETDIQPISAHPL